MYRLKLTHNKIANRQYNFGDLLNSIQLKVTQDRADADILGKDRLWLEVLVHWREAVHWLEVRHAATFLPIAKSKE
jgi:hypothetical protein